MERLTHLWKILSPTKTLENSSGDMETAFYESVYRVAYLAGLSSSDRDAPYILYSAFIKTTTAVFISCELWYAYSEPLSLDESAACINVIVIHLITLYKLKNLMDHSQIYKKLATSMESPYFDTSTDKRKMLVQLWARRHERYLKLLLFLGNAALAAWFMYPLLDELAYNLMVGVYVPFQYNTPTRYTFTYIIVGIAFYYTSLFVMVTDLLMQSHLIPLICQYSVLADCFQNLIKDCTADTEGYDNLRHLDADFRDKYTIRLGNLVEQHNFILNNSMDLRGILILPMLGQLAASGILICFVGYQATTSIAVNITKCLMSLFYLGYNMFSLYIICRWCEEITIQSQNIGEAVYFSGWETVTSVVPSARHTILLIILRAKNPMVFTAGGMYNLSLTSYSSETFKYYVSINGGWVICAPLIFDIMGGGVLNAYYLVKTSYSALTFLLRLQRD